MNAVFRHFDAWIRGDPIHIREKFGVPLPTSRGWYRHWLDDPSWRPDAPRRAQRRQVFTDEEEEILAEPIRTEFLQHGLLFTDADFWQMAIEQDYLWQPVDPSAEQAHFKQFMASNGFIYGFKKRNHFSSRRSYFERRSPPNPEIQTKFVAEICELLESANRDFVLNCDDTSWKLHPNRGYRPGLIEKAITSCSMSLEMRRNALLSWQQFLSQRQRCRFAFSGKA